MTANDHPHFPHLFRPYDLKGVELRNRVAISGHFAGWWVGPGGLPSDAFVAYLEERAKGGVGLFTIGATSPEPGSGWMQNLDDAIIPRYRLLAEAGHRHGTKVFAQLCHPGFKPLPGIPIIEPPPAIHPPAQQVPHPPVPVERLHDLVRAFGAAAGRGAVGGVDGVELHSHESFLHAELLNPYWNHREDEYGGSLENRMRFLVETLQAMRAAIGQKLPLGVRLKLDDIVQRGMGPEDYRECVRRLEAQRLVDYVVFTGGDGRFHHGPMPRPEGEWLPLVREMRRATRLTIMHAGRITTPEMAEKALAENLLDVVCMTKTHICDPHFTRKVFENRLDDIRYCTRCLQVCHGKMHVMSCVYNPFTKRELEWGDLKPAATKRKIVIVGAGPAGMEAAWNAGMRGHEVIVFEQSPRVGGQVWVGAASPLRKSWARIAEFYERQSRKGLFKVLLNTKATKEAVLALHPDVVIIATGSVPKRLEIAGGKPAITVHELVENGPGDAKRAVVFDQEGFNRALVAADLLSSRGVLVEFVTPSPSVGPKVESMMIDEMAHQLIGRHVSFHPGCELVGWDGQNALRIRQVETHAETALPEIDLVVALAGSTSVATLADDLRGAVKELHVIGDALDPQTVEEATVAGATLGRAL
jgi:2,4-dienoyl-CoA reductase-like NADH-dependent reductase (Old Yellow Enzyme family)/thioredoxin reductase